MWTRLKGIGKWVSGLSLTAVGGKSVVEIVRDVLGIPGDIEDAGAWTDVLGWPPLGDLDLTLNVLVVISAIIVLVHLFGDGWRRLGRRYQGWWWRQAEQSQYKVDSQRFSALHGLIRPTAAMLERWRRHIERDGEERWDEEKRDVFDNFSMLCVTLDEVKVWRPLLLEGEFDSDEWHTYLFNIENRTYFGMLDEARKLGSRLGGKYVVEDSGHGGSIHDN